MKPENKEAQGRVVEKDGNINVAIKRKRSWSFALYDYSILLRMNWVSFLTVSILTFAISCALFGVLIMEIRNAHNYDETKMSTEERDAFLDMYNTHIFTDLPVCFPKVDNHGDAFLFALESITTIGYGTKYPDPGCPEAVIMTMAMSFWSLGLNALFVGIFIAKFTIRTGMSRIRFSSKALVSQIDGSLFLVFRIADPMASGSDIVEVNAFMCNNHPDSSDEISQFSSDKVDIDHLGRMPCSCTIHGAIHSRVPLMWPLVIYHKIEERSPLYNTSPEDLETHKFEIIVKVSGVRSESGGTIFSTTSYTNNEISWGQYFDEDHVLFRRQEGDKAEEAYNMASFGQEDIDKVKEDVVFKTPRISAKALAEASKQGDNTAS